MKIIGVIPVRLKSTRLPEKALIDIEGLPMIVHVYKRAALAKVLDDLFVATDSPEVRKVIEQHGGKVVMTASHHQTGTDRIAEAVEKIDADIIVNIQGDEPLLIPEHIDQVVKPLLEDKSIEVAAPVTPYAKKNSPSDIKAVLDLNDFVLYCSRNDLPSDARVKEFTMWKMCFIIPMRKSFLMQYARWPLSVLEKIEFIEHLRILEHGHKIKAVRVDHADISVDTPEDLAEVRLLMKRDPWRKQYMGNL